MEREMEVTEPAKCGRWNPTGEQLKVLDDLFNAGLRTPSAEQIHKISNHLGSLGKIESKNVFYWFQNHKARERHHYSHKKRRRRPSPALLAAPLNDADQLFSADPSDDHTEFQNKEETKSKGTEKKTLELFPLTSASSSSSSSGYNGHRVVNVGAEQYKSAAFRWNSSLRELRFLDAVIDPPLELTLGFF